MRCVASWRAMCRAKSCANTRLVALALGVEEDLEVLDGDHQPTLGGVSGTCSRPSWAISIDSTATALSAPFSCGPFQPAASPPRKIQPSAGTAARGEQDDRAVAAGPDRLGQAGLVPEEQAGVADHAAAEHDLE